MKDLTTALKSGGLKPKERVLLLVRNDVMKDQAGREILTEADKYSLSEGWRPENNDQVHEYNRYIDAMKLMGGVIIDAQTTFLHGQLAHHNKRPLEFKLLHYSYHRRMRAWLKGLAEIKRVNIQEAVEIAEKQKAVKLKDGLDFDYAVYQLAFERLSGEDREKFLELYSDVEFDHAYLDEEEYISNLLDGKDELSKKNKEMLAGLVAEHCYNPYAKEYQFYHYFACIPLAEVGRQILAGKGIAVGGKPLASNQETDDEDDVTHEAIQKAMESYANEHDIAIEVMLKEACLKWLHGDLFEQYTPLALSNEKDLFGRWLGLKRQAATTLKKSIDKGELKIRSRSPDESRLDKLYSKCLYDDETEKSRQALAVIGEEVTPRAKGELDEKAAFATFSDKVITGESLQSFKSDWKFVKDFKERVDLYQPNLGIVYADDDSDHQGENLDREMLVADTDKNGELNFFSTFGLAVRLLGKFLESEIYFEEIEKDGGTALEFKDKQIEQVFIETKNELGREYATLLAFGEIFKKLSNVFEIDLSYKVKKWLSILEKNIDEHNNALDRAAGLIQDEDKNLFLNHQPVLQIDNALRIDKEGIKPNWEMAGEYLKKFQELLGSNFGSDEQVE